MKLVCKTLGHKMPEQGWWGDGLYAEISGGNSDNIGRTHFKAHLKCPRCKQTWLVARFHGGQVTKRLTPPVQSNAHEGDL